MTTLADLEDGMPDDVPADASPDYRALPRAVRDLHPHEGWLWLSDGEKAALVQTECEPQE